MTESPSPKTPPIDGEESRPERSNWFRFSRNQPDDAKLGRFIQGMLAIPLAFCLVAGFWIQYTEIEQLTLAKEQDQHLMSLLLNKAVIQQNRITNKDNLIASQKEILKEQEKVLATREGFLPLLQEASNAISSATDKVDVSANVAEIKGSQEAISIERKDVDLVAAHLQNIRSQIDSINSAVVAYDEEQERIRQQSARSGGGGGGYSGGGSLLERFTAYLRQAGGWQDVYEYPIVCDSARAIACNHMNGIISISSSLDSYGDSWVRYVAYHEHAHTIQGNYSHLFWKSDWYTSLFGRDLESLADCMAVSVLGYGPLGGYGSYCGPDQLHYARELWYGNVLP